MKGETCEIELKSGPTKFRSTMVRPFYQQEPEEGEIDQIDQNTPQPVVPPRTSTPPPEIGPRTRLQLRQRSNLCNEINITDDTPDSPQLTLYSQEDGNYENILDPYSEIFVAYSDKDSVYKKSRQKKINGLLENGVFKPIFGRFSADSISPHYKDLKML
ncbi:hypothetical protein OCU04_008654 [Sclerotinia nivalis]|uniref:Uncharacterized protein n=1 Tax=Sclerotinia nivalis TaxID=352851 RepID=A0A9X0DH79_9HELO|nr:hypothetical protein OCU04_008654 [Sclerotinia nivalis]